MLLAIDRNNGFVEVALVTETGCPTAYLVGVIPNELFCPLPYRLVRDDDALQASMSSAFTNPGPYERLRL